MREFKILSKLTNQNKNLRRYFNDISKYEILSPDKEAELCLKARNGDKKAKELVLKSNLRFVISVAKGYESKNSTLEDLISEGNKGLIEAIESFDHTTGFKFISYAVWHIRKNMLLYLSNFSRSIRIPTSVIQEMRRYNELEKEFISKNGREPFVDEIAEILEDPSNEIKISKTTLNAIKNNPVTIPLENNDDSDEFFSPINWIESDNSTDSVLIKNENKRIIKSLIKELKSFEQEVIILKYGLEDGSDPMTYKSIGEKMKKTSEWARAVSRKAEKKMWLIAKRKRIKNLLD